LCLSTMVSTDAHREDVLIYVLLRCGDFCGNQSSAVDSAA
jgi:hypothetical protein